jgi:hypothetical protein
MISAFVSRDSGFGLPVSEIQLARINAYRQGKQYVDKAAAREILKCMDKPPLTVSPFVKNLLIRASKGGYCDDTGMYRTVRSANPTYREHKSTRIDQVVDPIACDSETRFDTCMGLKHLSGAQTPRIRLPNRTHNKPTCKT